METRNTISSFIMKYKWLFLIIVVALSIRLMWIKAIIERDEGIFGFVADCLIKEKELIPADNKMPLTYFTYALSFLIFGENIIGIRLINDLLFIVSIIIFYHLVKKLFPEEKIALASTSIYAFYMNVPAFEGQLAMTESFAVPFIIFSIYQLINYFNSQKKKHLIFSALFLFIATLYKETVLIGVLVLIVSLMYYYKGKTKKFAKEVLFILKTFFLLIAAVVAVLYVLGMLLPIITMLKIGAIYLKLQISQKNYIPLGHILLILSEASPLIFLSALGLFNLLKEKSRTSDSKIPKKQILFSWLIFYFAIALLPPSFGHYYQFVIPPLSILAGLGIIFISSLKSNAKKNILFIISAVLLLFSLFFQSLQYPNMNVHWKNVNVVYSDFNSYSQQLQIAEIIKKNTNENQTFAFWGWQGELFWLSGRQLFRPIVKNNCPSLFLGNISNLSEKELYKQFYNINNLTTEKNTSLLIIFTDYPRSCRYFESPIFADFINNSILLNCSKEKLDCSNLEIYIKS